MIAIVLSGLVSAILDITTPFNPGTFGFRLSRATDVPLHVIVLRVSPGSPAWLKGIRDHDRLVIENSSLVQFQTPRAGAIARVRKEGTAPSTSIELTAVATEPRPFDIEWALIRILTLAIATVVAVSRPGHAAARALATLLACIGLFCNWALYPTPLAITGLVFRQCASVYGYPQFIIFAYTFSATAPISFKILYRRITLALGVLYAVGTIAELVLYFSDFHSQILEWAVAGNMLAFFLVGLRALFAELQRSGGEMRQRILWVLATMGFSLVGAVSWLLFLAMQEPPPWMDSFALTTVLLPVGLAYAILRHHIFNISVAINKALVFAVVTAILTPVFGLLEYFLVEVAKHHGEVTPSIDEFFHDPEHRAVAVLYTAIIVLVSTSLGWVHEKVEHYSKEIFFRDRTRALEDLHKACRDVMFISDTKVLAHHVMEELGRNLKAHGTVIYLQEGDGFGIAATSVRTPPQSIDGNDPGVLRLKSSQEVVFLSDVKSTIPGTYAIPIANGSQLGGFCAIDLGPHGESLVAEEIEAAGNLARSAGMVLAEIELRAHLQEIVELRAKLQMPAYPRVPSAKPLKKLRGGA